MDAPVLKNYRFVARPRRTKEAERFVTGAGTFVQDVKLPETKHVAPVASPYPRARIVSIDASAALAMPGVHAVVTGADLARDTEPMFQGLDIPKVRWYPLAHEITRYAGEWVAAVCADSRALAEDAAEKVEVAYEPLEPVVDPEAALRPGAPLVHPDHGSNLLYRGRFVWGPVEEDFAAAAHTLKFRARWGRSATVPIETFGALAQWNRGTKVLDVWASIQMTNYAEQLAHALRLPANSVLVHQEVDVGGSYGTKRGMKHTILCGYLTRKLGVPVRFIEDRIDNLAAGDAHGPDRIFDMEVAFESDGRIRSLKIFAIDDAGAYPGRAPFQLAKPITAIVGPYKINSVEYRPTSVTTNKTGEVAVRGFGQSPTNWAIETAVDKVARRLGIDRLELRRRNFIGKDEFPYEIPSGTKYDSGDYHTVLDKALELADYDGLLKRRDAIRAEGRLAGIGIGCCLEPSGGNNIHENLINPKLAVTTFMEACQVRIDLNGVVTAMMGTTTSGQGHETLVATIVAEELERDPDAIRVVHADSLVGLVTRSPVASRMAIMLGGAAAGAAQKLKKKLMAIAAHNLGRPVEALEYDGGDIVDRADRSRKLGWAELCRIAHQRLDLMPEGMEPALNELHVMSVPLGGKLPDENKRVQIYPCFAFQAHIPFVEIDPVTGKVTILDYAIAHDCGTVINPGIVRGMIVGGIAHGIGAALYEKFAYGPDGQFLAASFVDYLLPSVHEIPRVTDVEHCTPSPLTSHGQKGSGEGGYLGAPAAIASAVNDALAPLGVSLDEVPMRLADIERLLHG
jgi:3-oxo-Delta1-steroid hydratase/dehydrogenase large subunit